jgi:hypothetical protein
LSVAAGAAELQFNRDIRPILMENCFHCHGPDAKKRQADLRLDTEQGLFGKRDGDGAVFRGKPDESPLYQRIVSTDQDELMPPPDSHKKLTAEQKETLRAWIVQGAPWQGHWSFIPPRRPPLPPVKNTAWARNPIDHFVLAALEAQGLTPAPESDRRTLARRLSLDLIGLPPTPADVEAFVSDTAADAYEKYVEKLLAAPHWGEHRGRYWLDAARYADTHGIHFDNFREIWPYRDWVINAFNQNLPFDQFTMQQLAGDLVPNATLEQRVASGFNRCNITTNEGGVIEEEYLVLYTRDRTETTSQVWLGLTANCAVCHDHKLDQLTQREFYAMSAFFNNTTQGAMDGNIKDTPPVVFVPRTEDRPRWATIEKEIADAKQQVEARKQAARPEFDRFLAGVASTPAVDLTPTQGLQFHAPLAEGSGNKIKLTVDGKPREVTVADGVAWDAGHLSPQALKVQPGAAVEIADAGDFDTQRPFSFGGWVKPATVNGSGALLARMDDQHDFRGWDLWIENGRVGTHIISKWPEAAVKLVSQSPIKAGEWTHVLVTYDGSVKAAGVKVFINGQPQPVNVSADSLKDTIRTTVPLKIGQRHSSARVNDVMLQDLRVYQRVLPEAEVGQLAKASHIETLLNKARVAAASLTDAEKKELYQWWLPANDRRFQELSAKATAVEQEQAAIKARGALAHVMNERNEPAKAFILFRGEYDKRREQVAPNTPDILPPMPAELPRNRLGLAQWLLRPEHPLTARVTVNRFWQEVFGTGIVRTAGDFGVSGEAPSHPELLDWLAVEFRESGWDVKKFFRLLVSSATYRQSAATTPEKLEKDPLNRLLSRGPRFRMDAEMVRDYALAASGLLVPKLGRPSVKPYQPDGVWEAVAMIGSNTRDYRRDTGENLYRRSLYTFWKRSAPPASMEVFNAPSREVCTVRRERTNTPLQALVTLNDPQFVEAARHLAQRCLTEGGAATDTRLDYLARRILSRPLRPEESSVAQASLGELLKYYQTHAEDAKQLLAVGESQPDPALDAATLAAWTMLANELFNLDEVLCK